MSVRKNASLTLVEKHLNTVTDLLKEETACYHLDLKQQMTKKGTRYRPAMGFDRCLAACQNRSPVGPFFKH